MIFIYNKLKGKIVETYGSQSMFAKILGVKVQVVNAKLGNRIRFTQDDIIKWSNLLGIDSAEIGSYFFVVDNSKHEMRN